MPARWRSSYRPVHTEPLTPESEGGIRSRRSRPRRGCTEDRSMCQMCDEYENELVRMGFIEDAKQFREERQREHEAALAAARLGDAGKAKPSPGPTPRSAG